MYFIIAKYQSKYGLILYATKVSDLNAVDKINMDNVYINTLYFKGREEIKVGDVYELSTLKGENGLTYCFLT